MIAAIEKKADRILSAFEQNDRLLSYNLNVIILCGMCFLLWVDALTGALSFYGIGVASVSVLYKFMILMLVFITIASIKPKVMASFLVAIIVLMIGPTQSLLAYGDSGYYFKDFARLFKVVTPFIAFTYFYLVHKIHPDLTTKWLPRILFFNFAAVISNLLLGILGFGYPSYSGVEGQPGVGVNGFYTAGNELSACFALLFGFVLHYTWMKKGTGLYIGISIITFIMGTAIATKTAMLASLMLIFAIPLFNERENLFRLTKLKAIILLPFLVIATTLVVFIADFLTAVGLYDKLTWVLQEKGVVTLILSGRDIKYETILVGHFFEHMGELSYITGIGSSGIKHFEWPYYSIEIDPLDVFIWFGLLGIFYTLIALITMNFTAFQLLRSQRLYPPIVVLVNILLLILSFVSGHIWTSGMLGILWGALNALAFIPEPQNKECETLSVVSLKE